MKGFCLEVSGRFACFTRPEMKVERVSYDVITPSSARAIFSAIFWKPAINWRITKIEVLNPIRWTSIRRNEVSKVASPQSEGIFIEDERQQRAGLILRDVKYRLWAEFDMVEDNRRPKATFPLPEWIEDKEEKEEARKDETPGKYAAMFERRAKKGQYFMHPYLGCREFSCDTIRLVKDLAGEPEPVAETRDLGFMLYDIDYTDSKNPIPMFYRPKLVNGVITVPDVNSGEVVK